MEAWIDELAVALGQEPVSASETSEILTVARDVAHRVERKLTPVSTYLLGLAVGRRLAEAGGDRRAALETEASTLRSTLPPEEAADASPGSD
jgi:hypothetical protein